MSSDGYNALRVAIGYDLNDKQQKLQDDSAELAQMKIDIPMLFLGEADIDNRKTGRFVMKHLNDNGTGGIYALMYKGRTDDGHFRFESTNDYDYEVCHPEYSVKEIITLGLVPSPFDVGDKVTYAKAEDGPAGAVGTVTRVNFWGQLGHIHVEADKPYQPYFQPDRQDIENFPWTGSTDYMSTFKFA
jgi:hypothetical protein